MFYVTDFDRQCDFGMRKVKDFIKYRDKVVCKEADVNVGFFNNDLVYEVSLPGFKKENVTVRYSGNVILIQATYDKRDIDYVIKGFKHEDVSKKLYLMNDYIGGALRWQYVNGLMTLVVSPYSEPDDVVTPTNDDEDMFISSEQTAPEPNNP